MRVVADALWERRAFYLYPAADERLAHINFRPEVDGGVIDEETLRRIVALLYQEMMEQGVFDGHYGALSDTAQPYAIALQEFLRGDLALHDDVYKFLAGMPEGGPGEPLTFIEVWMGEAEATAGAMAAAQRAGFYPANFVTLIGLESQGAYLARTLGCQVYAVTTLRELTAYYRETGRVTTEQVEKVAALYR